MNIVDCGKTFPSFSFHMKSGGGKQKTLLLHNYVFYNKFRENVSSSLFFLLWNHPRSMSYMAGDKDFLVSDWQYIILEQEGTSDTI